MHRPRLMKASCVRETYFLCSRHPTRIRPMTRPISNSASWSNGGSGSVAVSAMPMPMPFSLASQLAGLAARLEDPRYLRLADYARACCEYWAGSIRQAYAHLEEVDPLHQPMMIEWLPFSDHPQVAAACYQGWALVSAWRLSPSRGAGRGGDSSRRKLKSSWFTCHGLDVCRCRLSPARACSSGHSACAACLRTHRYAGFAPVADVVAEPFGLGEVHCRVIVRGLR